LTTAKIHQTVHKMGIEIVCNAENRFGISAPLEPQQTFEHSVHPAHSWISQGSWEVKEEMSGLDDASHSLICISRSITD